MADAIRLVSVERGLDPRDFTLVAFGGAGPLHAVRLAEALSIGNVLVPPAPGNLSAMGLLCADVRHDLARTLAAPPRRRTSCRASRAMYDELLAEADAALAADGVAAPTRDVHARRRPALPGPELRAHDAGAPSDELARGFGELVARFNDQHRRIYGYQLAGREVQLVNARVTATGATTHAHWPVQRAGAPRQRRSAGAACWSSRACASTRRSIASTTCAPEQAHRGPGDRRVLAAARSSCRTGWNARIDARRNAHLARAAVGAAAELPPHAQGAREGRRL